MLGGEIFAFGCFEFGEYQIESSASKITQQSSIQTETSSQLCGADAHAECDESNRNSDNAGKYANERVYDFSGLFHLSNVRLWRIALFGPGAVLTVAFCIANRRSGPIMNIPVNGTVCGR